MIDDSYKFEDEMILTPTLYLELKKSFFNSSNFEPSKMQGLLQGNMGIYYDDASMTKRFVLVE